jgi:hypothetical protein
MTFRNLLLCRLLGFKQDRSLMDCAGIIAWASRCVSTRFRENELVSSIHDIHGFEPSSELVEDTRRESDSRCAPEYSKVSG